MNEVNLELMSDDELSEALEFEAFKLARSQKKLAFENKSNAGEYISNVEEMIEELKNIKAILIELARRE